MKRRALADDLASTFGGSRLLNVKQISQFTGRSRSTVERSVCTKCNPIFAGKTKLYHVTDIAAALDSNYSG